MEAIKICFPLAVISYLAASTSGYIIHSEQLGEKTTIQTINCEPVELLTTTCADQQHLVVLCQSYPGTPVILKILDYDSGDQLNHLELTFKAYSMAMSEDPCTLFMVAKDKHVVMKVSIADGMIGEESVHFGMEDLAGDTDGNLMSAKLNSPRFIEMIGDVAYITQESSLKLRLMSWDNIQTHALNHQSLSLASWDRALYLTQVDSQGSLILNKFEDRRQLRVSIPKTTNLNPSDGRFYSEATLPEEMSMYLQSEMLGPDMLVYTDDSTASLKLINFEEQSLSSVCYDVKDNATCGCVDAIIGGLLAHDGYLIYGIRNGAGNYTIVKRQYLPNAVSPEPKNGWRNSSDTNGQWFIQASSSFCIGNEISSIAYSVVLECQMACTRSSHCYAFRIDRANSNCVMLDRDMCTGNDPPGHEWDCVIATPAKVNAPRYTDKGEMEVEMVTPSYEFTDSSDQTEQHGNSTESGFNSYTTASGDVNSTTAISTASGDANSTTAIPTAPGDANSTTAIFTASGDANSTTAISTASGDANSTTTT